MPVPIVSFLIAILQLFCFGSHRLAVTTQASHPPIVHTQQHIAFHAIADEEGLNYTMGFEEAEDTDDDSNEVLKSILAASVHHRAFFPVAKHAYNAIPGGSFFFEQAPLFVLHRNFRV